jgi:PiT family inorganic phosphate transporter
MPSASLEELPWWIIFSAHAAIALGTLSGGWRIVKTMGMRITELQPLGGVCAETAGAFTLVGTSLAGIPVSTTHTITGAIVGVGSSRRLSAVRWGVARRIVWAWVLTIPAAATLSAATYAVAGLLWPRLPVPAQGALGVVVAALLLSGFLAWRRGVRSGRLAHA